MLYVKFLQIAPR